MIHYVRVDFVQKARSLLRIYAYWAVSVAFVAPRLLLLVQCVGLVVGAAVG